MAAKNNQFGRLMFTVSSGIFSSRVLGLARDVIFAYVFGTGRALAAFVVAFTFPNLLRALLGEGAFNNVFVPVFSERREKSGQEKAWAAACRIISVLAVVLVVLVFFISVTSIGLRAFAQKDLTRSVLSLTPALMPYAILVCLTAAFGGVLNSLNRFSLPAYSQTIMNVSLIIAALIAGFWLDGRNTVWLLVAAVLIAGVLQLLLHVHACARLGMRFRFDPEFSDPSVMRVGRLMTPVLIGAGVVQLNVVVDRMLAMFLGSGATTSLYYSQRLVYLPVSLFGVAMGTVALPALSKAWAANDHESARDSIVQALTTVLFLSIPAVALMAALRYPVVQLLFERGDFDLTSTRETVWALMFYLPGIPAFACAKVAVTPFYARHDTGTPVRIAAWCLLLNVVLNLILMQFLAQGGLALATAVCSFVNVGVLLWLVFKQFRDPQSLLVLGRRGARMIIAGIASFFTAVTVLDWLTTDPALRWRLARVVLPALVGGLVYLGIAIVWLAGELQISPHKKRGGHCSERQN